MTLLLSSSFSGLEHMFGFKLRFQPGEYVNYKDDLDLILLK